VLQLDPEPPPELALPPLCVAVDPVVGVLPVFATQFAFVPAACGAHAYTQPHTPPYIHSATRPHEITLLIIPPSLVSKCS
jgi:hypothetical protein